MTVLRAVKTPSHDHVTRLVLSRVDTEPLCRAYAPPLSNAVPRHLAGIRPPIMEHVTLALSTRQHATTTFERPHASMVWWTQMVSALLHHAMVPHSTPRGRVAVSTPSQRRVTVQNYRFHVFKGMSPVES
ncbi:hypothetical protein MVLG_00911 [Microbotryum lychnidis-dioicae p1A1 Lamole]|uniref:Uncharacterized protein n=1 Tax=Microbotryum lychnidis-dioicae (strain p1A1 Lamole / MvSl-1064) TaxID=683840 RepID=U5H0H9_USTV1|nr:hypothetical protein MVLG_00911 [Microbotryum lychnidis-dioicae p1A1 Lamole]|eukprot:KDE08806.1 hypothetical protein MVLG_00911 [Microbotryum lychnidis-dioicae p1A1 Lamole]